MAVEARVACHDGAMPDIHPADPLLEGVGGTRVEWGGVPGYVRESVQDHLGATVASAVSQTAGFSPGLAARIRLEDGRKYFVKAIAPDAESGAPGGQDSYRREARISAALPAEIAVPHLVDSWQVSGWVVLAFEHIDGVNPILPWRPDQLSRVLQALSETAVTLTPSPVAAPMVGSSTGPGHWSRLAGDPRRRKYLQQVDAWASENLERLIELETHSGAAGTGDTLLHGDIRADNLLLTDDRVYLVDWPHAKIGAPWVDLVWFLPSVAMQGGPSPEKVFSTHPLSADVDRFELLPVLAAFTGFMVDGATQPPPPGLPRLRPFQLAQGQRAIHWLHQTVQP